MARHQAGETLASIARTYDCSPPAISYIVSRSRARNSAAAAAAPGPATPPEPQLVKAHPAESPATFALERQASPTENRPGLVPAAAAQALSRGGPPRIEPRLFADDAVRPAEARNDPPPHGSNGSSRHLAARPDGDSAPAGNPPRVSADLDRLAQNGEARRTLHLSLSEGNGGDSPHHPAPSIERHPAPQAPLAQHAAPTERPVPVRMLSDVGKGKEGGAIDHALRERVDADIAAFLAAFDAALAQDTPETRAGLREATDRLLRAGARTRIELERLEARVPLPPRDRSNQDAAAWRHR